MPPSLEGHFSVEDSARLFRNYRYAVERMTRALAGWIALTPEMAAKLVMGRQVWDNAQHADAFGRRLPELRAHAQVSEPASPAFVAFMDALESAEGPGQTVERLVGVHRVLKPHLLAVYARHLEQANLVYEPPTRVILERCIADERRHVAMGETVLRHLSSDPGDTARAVAWAQRLTGLLTAARGVTGDALSASRGGVVTASVDDDSPEAREFVRLGTAAGGWSIPEDLDAALRAFGEALVTRNVAGVRRWLDPAGPGEEMVESALTRLRPSRHDIVAFARLGAQRLVKMRLSGPGGTATLLTRWAAGEGGWRALAVEVVHVVPSSPAA